MSDYVTSLGYTEESMEEEEFIVEADYGPWGCPCCDKEHYLIPCRECEHGNYWQKEGYSKDITTD